jgi:hypothetical protein
MGAAATIRHDLTAAVGPSWLASVWSSGFRGRLNFLCAKLYEHTSVVITTNLDFAEWSTVHHLRLSRLIAAAMARRQRLVS